MKRQFLVFQIAALLVLAVCAATAPRAALAQGIEPDVQAALNALMSKTPAAKNLASQAKGILVFPRVAKAGFIVGAQYGDGQLIKNGQPAGRYNIAAGSYGLQAGVQSFAYAMFFMTDSALQYLENTAGFEIGMGPSVVVVDAEPGVRRV